jgi:hypothetical protein
MAFRPLEKFTMQGTYYANLGLVINILHLRIIILIPVHLSGLLDEIFGGQFCHSNYMKAISKKRTTPMMIIPRQPPFAEPVFFVSLDKCLTTFPSFITGFPFSS